MKSSHSLCISKKSWSVFVKKPNYNSEWVIVNSNIKSHKLETPNFSIKFVSHLFLLYPLVFERSKKFS